MDGHTVPSAEYSLYFTTESGQIHALSGDEWVEYGAAQLTDKDYVVLRALLKLADMRTASRGFLRNMDV